MADHSNSVAGRFWLCMRTITEMMKDRYGVTIPLESFEETAKKLRPLDLIDADRAQALMNQFEMCFESAAEGVTVRIIYVCGKVGVKTESMLRIQKLFPAVDSEGSQNYDDIDDEKVAEFAEAQRAAVLSTANKRLILVQVEGCTITPPARKLAAKIPAIVEIFDSHELLRNITHNRLQPRFTVLAQSEAEDVKKRYCVTDEFLPKLRWEDPIRRYYGLRVGQVIRCVRMADGGKEIHYRIVLPPAVSKKK